MITVFGVIAAAATFGVLHKLMGNDTPSYDHYRVEAVDLFARPHA